MWYRVWDALNIGYNWGMLLLWVLIASRYVNMTYMWLSYFFLWMRFRRGIECPSRGSDTYIGAWWWLCICEHAIYWRGIHSMPTLYLDECAGYTTCYLSHLFRGCISTKSRRHVDAIDYVMVFSRETYMGLLGLTYESSSMTEWYELWMPPK